MLAHGQWRIGVNGGADVNHFIVDKHYQTDFQYKDRWGLTLGVMGQYDVNQWLGVRAELDWTQKNYRHTRETKQLFNYKYVNNYLQLPVMASFSFGGQKVRGFLNTGVYGGYWLNSSREGYDTNTFSADHSTSARTSHSTASVTSAGTSVSWAVPAWSIALPATGLHRWRCVTTTAR